MTENKKTNVAPGSKQAPEKFYIQITPDGPYLIYGNPPIDQEIIAPNEEGSSWEYRKGLKFDSSKLCVALCRCGASKNKPYCDGSHTKVKWDPRETSTKQSIIKGVRVYKGPTQTLIDNEKYCAFARFCDAYGRIWNLVKESVTEEEQELVKREAAHCPTGRLILVNNETQEVYEPHLEPSIGVIQDPIMKVSGPLWVKGGIRIESADGSSYEIRNRVTLCRCGMSSNKPFCDGTHASMKFYDGLPME